MEKGQGFIEAGRYHLIVSKACPWANRCMAMVSLKDRGRNRDFDHPSDMGQIEARSVSRRRRAPRLDFNSGDMSSPNGSGVFNDGCDEVPAIFKGPVRAVRDIYPGDAVVFTVPILYDTKNQEIVSNESSEILRMLNTEFNAFATGEQKDLDLYPAPPG